MAQTTCTKPLYLYLLCFGCPSIYLWLFRPGCFLSCSLVWIYKLPLMLLKIESRRLQVLENCTCGIQCMGYRWKHVHVCISGYAVLSLLAHIQAQEIHTILCIDLRYHLKFYEILFFLLKSLTEVEVAMVEQILIGSSPVFIDMRDSCARRSVC